MISFGWSMTVRTRVHSFMLVMRREVTRLAGEITERFEVLEPVCAGRGWVHIAGSNRKDHGAAQAETYNRTGAKNAGADPPARRQGHVDGPGRPVGREALLSA